MTLDLVNTVRDEHRRVDRTDRVGDSYYNDIIECYHGDYNLQISFFDSDVTFNYYHNPK